MGRPVQTENLGTDMCPITALSQHSRKTNHSAPGTGGTQVRLLASLVRPAHLSAVSTLSLREDGPSCHVAWCLPLHPTQTHPSPHASLRS